MPLNRQDACEYIIDNQKRWYRIALSYVRREEPALDIVQNMAVRILENYKNITYIKTWSYKVLIHECMAFLKREKREVVTGDVEQEEIYEKDLFPKDDINYYMDRLPENMRIIVILHYYEELTLKEISEITGVNINTVKYRLYAALKRLKRNMEVMK